MPSFLQDNWLDLLTGATAVVALFLAWRAGQTADNANDLAAKANLLASQANEFAERGIRVSKLPSVHSLYQRFRELAVGLEKADRETLQSLNRLSMEVRLVSRDRLYPPVKRTYSAAARIWSNAQSGQSQSASEQTKWANYLAAANNEATKAFEDFVNE